MIEFDFLGIKIKIKFMFVALVTLFLIVDKSSISVIALFACIIHELGHLFMFILIGYKPRELAFELTGIRLVKPSASLTYSKEILVQLAGSGTNFAVFILLCGTVDSISKVSIFAVTHLIIGIFNLLPLKSFDGGKLLELFLIRLVSINTTQFICTIVDFLCILVILTAGIFAFFQNKNSFTLIILSSYLMISAISKTMSPKRQHKKTTENGGLIRKL